MTPRTLAVDWSGAVRGSRRKIWLAEAAGERLVNLENGRTREELATYLVREADRTPDLIVGLDFAFSFPDWFLQSRGWTAASDLWAAADTEGEEWLRTCSWPLWGRPGKAKPTDVPEHFRRTELQGPTVAGIRPKSVFQIGGAGAVGTGSIRGMPILRRLCNQGFAVWPFDQLEPPAVIEIYPRALTQAVNKSSHTDRETYLKGKFSSCDSQFLALAATNEDAFDAAVSALVIARHIEAVVKLSQPADDLARREGLIWYPIQDV
jgi:hypothetical protein